MNNKGFAPLLLVIIIAIIGIAGYFAYQKGFLSKQPAYPSASATPFSTPDPTANWKTFISPDSNFSLKYPPDYKLEAVQNLGYVINNNITLPAYPYSEVSQKGETGLLLTSDEDVVLQGGIKAKKFKGYIGEVGGNIAENFVRYEIYNPGADEPRRYNNVILWELPQNINYEEKSAKYPSGRTLQSIPKDQEAILDQILSTFKFLSLAGEIEELSKCVPTTESGNPKCYSQTTKEACLKFTSECRWAIALP